VDKSFGRALVGGQLAIIPQLGVYADHSLCVKWIFDQGFLNT
jgi:hypothetical protein